MSPAMVATGLARHQCVHEAIPLGALISEAGGEPRERAGILRDCGREGNIPWENMLARKEVQPLYK